MATTNAPDPLAEAKEGDVFTFEGGRLVREPHDPAAAAAKAAAERERARVRKQFHASYFDPFWLAGVPYAIGLIGWGFDIPMIDALATPATLSGLLSLDVLGWLGLVICLGVVVLFASRWYAKDIELVANVNAPIEKIQENILVSIYVSDGMLVLVVALLCFSVCPIVLIPPTIYAWFDKFATPRVGVRNAETRRGIQNYQPPNGESWGEMLPRNG